MRPNSGDGFIPSAIRLRPCTIGFGAEFSDLEGGLGYFHRRLEGKETR